MPSKPAYIPNCDIPAPSFISFAFDAAGDAPRAAAESALAAPFPIGFEAAEAAPAPVDPDPGLPRFAKRDKPPPVILSFFSFCWS
jgi:hypothetical protein